MFQTKKNETNNDIMKDYKHFFWEICCTILFIPLNHKNKYLRQICLTKTYRDKLCSSIPARIPLCHIIKHRCIRRMSGHETTRNKWCDHGSVTCQHTRSKTTHISAVSGIASTHCTRNTSRRR